MKIRTITLGISEIPTLGIIRWAGEQLERASDHFSSCGYSVQSRRLALNHWDASVGSMPTAQRTDLFQMVDALSTEAEITSCPRKRGIGLHLDGARLFVASAYTGRSPAQYAALFDTVYVSLWKCFNAAGGAVLAGPKAVLADLYQVRRMFGGGLWGAWPYAIVAEHYAKGYVERLTEAVRVAEELLELLSRDKSFVVERVPHGTNLFHC